MHTLIFIQNAAILNEQQNFLNVTVWDGLLFTQGVRISGNVACTFQRNSVTSIYRENYSIFTGIITLFIIGKKNVFRTTGEKSDNILLVIYYCSNCI